MTKTMMPLKLILITAIFCMLLVSSLQAEDHTQISAPTTFAIPEHLLQQVKSRYGAQAATRLRSWQQLIEHAANRREIEKLQMANNFINQAQFIDNSHLEDESNLRTTPIEFLIEGSGDSEDFSIAKYITLREMGIPDSKLRLTYTETLPDRTSRMILAYYFTPDAEPLLLDYLDKRIRPASSREDIQPIYSYKAEDIWIIHSAIKLQMELHQGQLGDQWQPQRRRQSTFWNYPEYTMGSTHY
jgi:predicted transglutaminase-like cysteine proteinase